MTILFLVAGLVLGLCLFLMIRRSYKKAEKKGELETQEFKCAHCTVVTPASDAWVRSGLRGDLFECKACNRRAWR